MTDKNNNLDLDAALATTTHKVEDFYSKNKKNIQKTTLEEFLQLMK